MNIIYKNTDEVIPYKNNPRNNTSAVKYVKKSIEEFGFKVPIVIDKNNVIINGHTRYKASIELGLKEVPCIIADDLSEEQVKAFRIADNKVAEKAKWDIDLLDKELQDIISIDMEDFGLDLSKLDEQLFEPNQRYKTNDAYNLDIVGNESSENFWEMPVINNDNFIPKELIGFNYAKTSMKKDVGIHFYLDDYQFERLWNNKEKYVDILKQYECILSPDFSLYLDMPMPMKIWNVFRSRLIGQYYQSQGIKVIPTISWAEEKTFDFAFEGIPKGSIVSISTIGVKKDKKAYKIWKAGVDELIKRIEPSAILIYGGKLKYDYGDIKVVYYENKVTERMIENGRQTELVVENTI